MQAIPFNTAFEGVLVALATQGAPSGNRTFPPGVPNAAARIQDGMSGLEWVVHVHSQTPERSKHQFAITPEICFAADVTWSTLGETTAIQEVHCQAAVTLEGSFENLPDTKSISEDKLRYLRLDFEPWNLGTYVFPDSVPHVHAVAKGEPRFPVTIHAAAPHVDFIELLVRNFLRRDWDAWAVRVWKQRVAAQFPPDATRYDVLAQVRAAFRENKHRELCTQFRDPVLKWKAALHTEKQLMCSLGRNGFYDVIDY